MKKKLHFKFFLILFIIVNCQFSIVNSSAQPYTVYSCDFENWTDGKPDGWEAAFSTIYQYTPAYSGSYACKITGSPFNGFLGATETFPIYWGKKYVLSFVAKLVNGHSIYLNIYDPENIYENYTRFYQQIYLGADWQEYEIEFIPACRTQNPVTGLHHPASTSGNRISFRIVPLSPPTDSVEFVIDNIKLVAKDHTMEFDYLDGNNLKAYIDPIVPFLRNNNFDINYFEAPKNSGKSTIYTSNIWLGGVDTQGQLHVAAQMYCQHGFDFWVGPVSNDYEWVADTLGGSMLPYEMQAYSDDYIKKYHHTWKVSKADINYHRAHFADPGYVMPWSIANWPAHGRTEHGESTNLAPFKSVSGNAVYNPWQGDYPDIRGDQAVLFITNDMGGEHTESKGNPLGVEIIGMAYAFNSSNEALQNTIFLSYNIHNKSAINYENFYFGYWSDFDIGYGWDDYVGCDTLMNLMYGYNGTEIDGNGESYAYGANPPAQGAMFLNQKINAFAYHNNSYDTLGDPSNAPGYYNLLRAIWKDGLPMTMWGTGYNEQSGERAHFMFPGDPIAKTGWTEYTPYGPGSEPNYPGDRRGLMSAGPFMFPAGSSLSFDIALPFARSAGNLASVALLKKYATEIQQYFDEHILGIKDYPAKNNVLLVFPNPSNGQFTVSSEQVIESIELYDILGKKVFSNTPNDFSTQINARLPQGLYIYRAVLKDQSIASGKIVVK